MRMPVAVVAVCLILLPLLFGAAIGLVVRIAHRRSFTGWALPVVAPLLGLVICEAVESRWFLVGVWDAAMVGLLVGFGVLITAHRAFGNRANLTRLSVGTGIALGLLEIACVLVLPEPPQISDAARPTLFLSRDRGPQEGGFAATTSDDVEPYLALSSRLACAAIYGTRARGDAPIDLPTDPAPDPDPRRRVLHLGDSMVFGFGVDPSERFTSVLNRLEPGAVHLNSGVQGTAPDVYLAVLRRWVARQHLDAVVMHLTHNDLQELDQPSLHCAGFQTLMVYGPGAPRLRHSTARDDRESSRRRWMLINSPPPYLVRALIHDSVAARWLAVASLLLPRRLGYGIPDDPTTRIAHFEALLRAARDELWTLGIAFAVDLFDERRDVEHRDPLECERPVDQMRSVVRRLGIPEIETLPTLHQAVARGESIYVDRQHFNPAGHALFAHLLHEQMPAAFARSLAPR